MMKCPNQFGLYKNRVSLPIPHHMREEGGGFYTEKTYVLLDLCIAEEIQHLWDNKIHTFGSCCGHGIQPGNILVIEEDIKKMEELGYVEDKEFRLKQPNHDCRNWFCKSKHKTTEVKVEIKELPATNK